MFDPAVLRSLIANIGPGGPGQWPGNAVLWLAMDSQLRRRERDLRIIIGNGMVMRKEPTELRARVLLLVEINCSSRPVSLSIQGMRSRPISQMKEITDKTESDPHPEY